MDLNYRELEDKVKLGLELNEAGRLLESVLRKGITDATRGPYYYLYGLVFYKLHHVEKAIEAFEEALKSDDKSPKVYFLLYKIFYKKGNNLKAINCLEKCIALDYKANYCHKMLVKIYYLNKDYPIVINYLAENGHNLRPKVLISILRTECLKRLKLDDEAMKEYENLLKVPEFRNPVKQWLENLLEGRADTEYEKNYFLNLEFFKNKGLNFDGFEATRFKISRYLDDELIYDGNFKKFIVKLEDQPITSFSLSEEDTFMIFNPDHIEVFKLLEKALTRLDSPQYRKKITALPVFVVEQNVHNWELVMQLFDFNALSAWQNMNFYIGINDEDLAGIMLDEYFPFPNALFGSGLENLKKILEEVKTAKDELYQRRKEILQDYYQNKMTAGKNVLIITTIYNDSLLCYGQALKEYLAGQGFNCRLYCENAPYYKFTNYSDARMMEEFRPDSIIHFFAIKEESDLFKDIKIPFTSWFLFYKAYQKNVSGIDWNQKLILTGNVNMLEYFKTRGFNEVQITQIPLPVVLKIDTSPVETEVNKVSIITNLDDMELILKKLAEQFYNLFSAKQKVTIEELSSIFRAIYFEVYTEQISRSFTKPPKDIYFKIAKNNFAKKDLALQDTSIEKVSTAVKRELENSILKLVQARWLINCVEDFKPDIYGSGWEKDPSLKPYYKGELDFSKDAARYQQAVIRNKINLYLGNKINNESLMQPDLINGIAAGGFFLVNDILVKEHGDSILKPFGGLMETYGSEEEMLDKVHYFLENEIERRERAKELQEYVQKNFKFDLIIRETFLVSAESLELN